MSGGRAGLHRQSLPSPWKNTMCLSQPPFAQPPKVRDADDAKTFSATLDAMAARRPSWTTLRGVFKQPASSSRPGLPRRFHTKINLNDYWGVLEKVVKVEVSWSRSGRQQKQQQQQAADAAMDVDNEVNENLANERAEQTRMDVDQTVTVEEPVAPAAPTDDDLQKENTPVAQLIEHVPIYPMKEAFAEQARKSPLKQSADSPSPRRGDKARRRSAPCGPTPLLQCGTSPGPSPPRRAPLGTLNGFESRGQLKKNLSPLSVFADNLARRLARQY